jgi:membrane protein implicated in regulation of membrane protease activity
MKLSVMHLWALACIAYGLSVFMVFERKLEAAMFFTMLYMLLLICTKWVTNNEQAK